MTGSRTSKVIASAIAAILTLFVAPVAQAACSDPSAPESTMVYNNDHNTMQFCNGTNWIDMGVGGGGASTFSDLSDVDTSGKSTNDIVKWDGSNWVSSTGGDACASTSDDLSDITQYTGTTESGTVTLVNITSGGGCLLGGIIAGHYISSINITVDGVANGWGRMNAEAQGSDFHYTSFPTIKFDSSLKIVYDAANSGVEVSGIATVKQ